MQAVELPNGEREVRRVDLTPDDAPLYHALHREQQWLEDAWPGRWAQGN